jgi:hypothetical protein
MSSRQASYFEAFMLQLSGRHLNLMENFLRKPILVTTNALLASGIINLHFVVL